MDYLTKFKNGLTVHILVAVFLPSSIGIIIWFLLTEYTAIDSLIILITSTIAGVTAAVYCSHTLLIVAMQPLKQLQDIVMYSSKSDRALSAPNLEQNILGKELVQSLARQIYDLSSSSQNTQNDGGIKPIGSILDDLPVPIIGLDKNQKINLSNIAAGNYFKHPEDINNAQFYDIANLRFNSESNFDSWLAEVTENSVTASTQWYHVRHYENEENYKQFDLIAKYSKDSTSGSEILIAIFDKTELYNMDENEFSLIAMAVHELRTPLTVMRGYIEVLEDEMAATLSPEMASFVKKMQASSQQLVAFVGNILNVAKLEENQLSLQLHPENWSNALTAAIQDLQLRASVRNVSLKVTIDDNIPEVAIDRVSIYEVINNLVDNAIKYTHDGDEIIINSKLSPDGMVETSIVDHGIGIPQAVIGDLFQKFHRSHKSRVQVGGTGLGLYLSKALIHAHGGTISVESKEGEGSTFTFTVQPYTMLTKNQNSKQDDIIRGAHGWIKNHSLYRN